MKNVVVLKFGGSSLQTPGMILGAAQKVKRIHEDGKRIIVVVSAMGETTNGLIELANQVSKAPSKREMDMLVSAGERISMALMSMALQDLGCDAISFTGSQAGIMTSSQHNEAEVIEVKPFRVEEALSKNKIVVLAGFQGVDPSTKEITTLGRGGSDITAVAFASYFNSKDCYFLKDVEGLQSCDPKKVTNIKHIENIDHHKLLMLCQWGAKILHPRSVEFAINKNIVLKIYHSSKENSRQTQVAGDSGCSARALCSIYPVFKCNIFTATKSLWLKEFLSINNLPPPRATHFTDDFVYIVPPSDLIKSYKAHLEDCADIEAITEVSAITAVGFKAEEIAPHIGEEVNSFAETNNSVHLFTDQKSELKLLNSLHQKLF